MQDRLLWMPPVPNDRLRLWIDLQSKPYVEPSARIRIVLQPPRYLTLRGGLAVGRIHHVLK